MNIITIPFKINHTKILNEDVVIVGAIFTCKRKPSNIMLLLNSHKTYPSSSL